MWPRWRASARSTAGTSGEAALAIQPTRDGFSFSKGVHALLLDEHVARASASSEAPPNTSSSFRCATVFHRVRAASAAIRAWRAAALPNRAVPNRIVLYFTSLRVVRKTFEDCRMVRSILRGFRVAVDERDLSMDSSFLAELKGLLGRRQLVLPQVFIGDRYIGGADEIRQLHESGELKRIVEGIPAVAPGTCDACGGMGFVLCQICSGSRKCFSQKGGGFRSCSACNENGLLRCPGCCPQLLLDLSS